jgi:hypothetical protein
VVAVLIDPDSRCLMVTVAPANGWLLAPTTSPLMAEEVFCAINGEAERAMAKAMESWVIRARLKVFI